jgi:autotransporter translocation and assembly factor TamB
MNIKLRILLLVVAALATLAPVCVLSGGDTKTLSESVTLADGALVEVIGENAEVRIRRSTTNALELDATLYNEEFVDLYMQTLADSPPSHLVISATTSTGGATTANSLLEIGIPRGIRLIVRTTNGAIVVDEAALATASLNTTDGKITVTHSSGDFDLNTTNSEVTVQSVDGTVKITTSNAHVWFEGVVVQGTNSISTTNGDIAVRLKNGSDVKVSGGTHNGNVTVNGGDEGVTIDGDVSVVDYRIDTGTAILNITNGPGAIHINPDTIAVFDGDS